MGFFVVVIFFSCCEICVFTVIHIHTSLRNKGEKNPVKPSLTLVPLSISIGLSPEESLLLDCVKVGGDVVVGLSFTPLGVSVSTLSDTCQFLRPVEVMTALERELMVFWLCVLQCHTHTHCMLMRLKTYSPLQTCSSSFSTWWEGGHGCGV